MSNGGPFSAPVLKVIQECISLTAFGLFSVRMFLDEKPLCLTRCLSSPQSIAQRPPLLPHRRLTS